MTLEFKLERTSMYGRYRVTCWCREERCSTLITDSQVWDDYMGCMADDPTPDDKQEWLRERFYSKFEDWISEVSAAE